MNGRTWSTTRWISSARSTGLALEGLAEILGAKQGQHVGDQPGELPAAGRDLAEDLLLLVRSVGIGQPQAARSAPAPA